MAHLWFAGNSHHSNTKDPAVPCGQPDLYFLSVAGEKYRHFLLRSNHFLKDQIKQVRQLTMHREKVNDYHDLFWVTQYGLNHNRHERTVP